MICPKEPEHVEVEHLGEPDNSEPDEVAIISGREMSPGIKVEVGTAVLGCRVGELGAADGNVVGTLLGDFDGATDGEITGKLLGSNVGLKLGSEVGLHDGSAEGRSVGNVGL